MIQGIGIDVIEVDRIAQAIQRQGDVFISRLFTKNEQLQIADATPEYIAQYYAGRFAAKEAIVKAFGTGFRGIDWKDIEITNDPLGKPCVRLAEHVAVTFNHPTLLLSISHSKNTACAFCLWQSS
ncbi:MAG: holo-ACP synthase [Verrucomicrobia bacterium]|nr:holo-ACP synthase [Verrucomicrobiota bacterium]